VSKPSNREISAKQARRWVLLAGNAGPILSRSFLLLGIPKVGSKGFSIFKPAIESSRSFNRTSDNAFVAFASMLRQISSKLLRLAGGAVAVMITDIKSFGLKLHVLVDANGAAFRFTGCRQAHFLEYSLDLVRAKP
jgi:hypothetical protein